MRSVCARRYASSLVKADNTTLSKAISEMPGAAGTQHPRRKSVADKRKPSDSVDVIQSTVLPEARPDMSLTDTGVPVELQAYSALQEKLKSRFSTEQLTDVSRAFVLAREAHSGQTRSSGEPYITHPVAVAGIVFDMGLDYMSVMAALMHDVLEDTPVSRDDLVNAFGEEVTHIVDGVSKLNHLKFRTKAEAQAQSFMKMLLAMVTDIRVIMIKLGDRLHNMRTIGSLRLDKRRRIGKETLEVYAPIASRLGMFAVKSELEDLGFAACYPMRSRILESTVEQLKYSNQILERVVSRIQASLSEKGISADVWERGVPAGAGDRGDPTADGDGSGNCFVTDNVAGNSDVDDGSTILTSPLLDASVGSAQDAVLSYYRWYNNAVGASPQEDVFEMEISNDNGANWVPLETVGPTGPEVFGGWVKKQFLISDFIAPTSTMRVRFIASDLGEGSVVEAAVDGVEIQVVDCVTVDVAINQRRTSTIDADGRERFVCRKC